MQHSQPIMSAVHAPQNPACLCHDCERTRWNSREIYSAGVNCSSQECMSKEVSRKYTHNPYALGPTSQVNPSSPPIVTPGDAIASIVPNVSDYVYSTPQYISSVHGFQANNHAVNSANSIQDQFNQSLGIIADVACTPKGRTMLQSILRVGHPLQVKHIADELCATEIIATRSMLDTNACHVVRSLLEVIDPVYLKYFVSPSVMNESHILQLATSSQHTRRILQTLFERFNHEQCCNAIASVLARHAQYLATTQQGCIALMRVVDNAQSSQKNMIHESLLSAMVSLATDPYGNYVIQHAIERGDPVLISNAVMTYFLISCPQLCCNKFASNVMEKILYNVIPQTRRAVIESIISHPATLQSVMNDGYGNFVIQAAIDSCCNYQEYRRMVDRVRPLIHSSPYGHKIDAKLRSKRASHTLNASTTASSATSSATNTAPTTPRDIMAGHSLHGMYNMNSYMNWMLGHEVLPEGMMHRA